MIALDKLTPDQLETYLHMQAIVDRQAADADKIIALRSYYDGDQGCLLSKRQIEYLQGVGPTSTGFIDGAFPFAHNVVRSVIDTLRERLAVTGVAIDGERSHIHDKRMCLFVAKDNLGPLLAYGGGAKVTDEVSRPRGGLVEPRLINDRV